MRSTGPLRYPVLVVAALCLIVLIHGSGPASASPPGPERRLEEQMLRRSEALLAFATSATNSDGIASYATVVRPNWRYGVSVLGQAQMDWLSCVGAGWYSNFGSSPYSGQPAVEFAPVVRVEEDKNGCEYLSTYTIHPPLDLQFGSTIAAHPGALWTIGNEPDRGPNPPDPADPLCANGRQDDTHPAVYAQAYHEVYEYIKQRDPTAQFANAGLVEITPGRLSYLDLVENAYQSRYGTTLPVDVWNMHLYILPEANPLGEPNGIAQVALGTDPALATREAGGDPKQCGKPGIYCFADHDSMTAFEAQVRRMRTWMKARGEQDKPFIITEYSLLYPYIIDPGGTCFVQDENGQCFTPARVTAFLNNSFSYLNSATDPDIGMPADENRLVQQWLWFSMNLNGGAGTVSNLLTDDLSALTEPGRAYRDIVAAQAPSVNLYIDPLPAIVAGTVSAETGTGTAHLAATVRNGGNTASPAPFSVTFYADQALLQPIGSVQIPAGLAGCKSGKVTASVDWTGLAVGKHSFWVVADSGQNIVETDDTDNTRSAVAQIFTHRIVLPAITR